MPIYFFTLIASYKYGFRVGLLTAVLSPVINHLLFAMPSAAVLPILLIKSVLFAGSSALAARYAKKISLPAILVAILAYQVVGTAFEWVIERNFTRFPYGSSGDVDSVARWLCLTKRNC